MCSDLKSGHKRRREDKPYTLTDNCLLLLDFSVIEVLQANLISVVSLAENARLLQLLLVMLAGRMDVRLSSASQPKQQQLSVRNAKLEFKMHRQTCLLIFLYKASFCQHA